MPETTKDKAQKDINDLNQLYSDAESADKDIFAEMRTNIQLVAGNHYERTNSRFLNRVRDSKNLPQDQKIRITKNHIGRISRIYQNSILSSDPDVTVSPKQEKEIQHQKAAEQHDSVLSHIKNKHGLSRKKHLWCKDYTEIGETWVKTFWDPQAGIQIGWAPETDDFGRPIINADTGGYVQSQVPVMSGDLVFETIHGFDVLRDPSVKSIDESQYIILRKMESIKDLEKKFGHTEEIKKFIKESTQDTFRVFQASGNNYHQNTKGLAMVREYYFRKCAQYPNGYFYITTEHGILAEGELPFGIWPLHTVSFDENTTSPRGRSIIKQLRPYQIEINRAASKMAEHQITLGDDKIIFQGGSKPSTGATQPGIRQISVAGMAPMVIPGRTGEQYLEYINSQIAEMYQISDVAELDKEINGQIDPYTLLFRSIRQKQKFSFYSEKFENFLISIHETALNLFKRYASPHIMIPVLGRNEQVNMEEFKNSPDVCWEIKIEGMSDDLETKMGKQITLNHVLQYIGPQLDKKDIGKFLRLSPYLNTEQMFEDMTQDWDNLVNERLALDRGQYPQSNLYENHEYMVKGLVSRMKQPDFPYLHPQIQQNYQRKIQEHEQAIAMQQMQIKQAQSEFIPSGGYAVAADLYVPDPNNPKSTKRVRVPSESLTWLLKQLEIQGSSQEAITAMGNQQATTDIARMVTSGTGSPSPDIQNQIQGLINNGFN